MAAGSRVNSGSTKNGLSGSTTKWTRSPGMSTRGTLVDDLADLRDDDAVLERGRLDHGRRVLGVGAGIEVAVAVGAHGGDQRDVAASGR